MTRGGQPIIDAHHHFWDPDRNYHPWLRDEPMIPFRYGDYSSIRRRFMPEDYEAVTGRHNVVGTVTMEGEWDESDPVGETVWMSQVAERYGGPIAHIARAFLHRADVADVLAGHAAHPIVRGIRHKPTAAGSPDAIEAGAPGSISDPVWRQGYSLLGRHGFHFELQAPWWHVDELIDLVAAYPETPVVINHAFVPADRGEETLSGWRRAVSRAAELPQSSMKISGIGVPGRPWSLDDQRPIIDHCIEAFGTKRCMFASNFPVDGLCGSFEAIYDGFASATSGLGADDRHRLFHDNAVRIYRLPLSPLADKA